MREISLTVDDLLRAGLRAHDQMQEHYSPETRDHYLKARGAFRKALLRHIREELDELLVGWQVEADKLQRRWEILQQYKTFYEEHQLVHDLGFLSQVKLPRSFGLSDVDRSECLVAEPIELSPEAKMLFTDRWSREVDGPIEYVEVPYQWKYNSPLGG